MCSMKKIVAIELALFVVVIFVLETRSLDLVPNPLAIQQPTAVLRSLSQQGIVVPKRSAFIVGLNQQFKHKTTSNNKTSGQQQQQGFGGASQLLNGTFQQQDGQQQQTQAKSPAAIFAASFPWLGSRAQQQQQQQRRQPQHQQTLYLDRHQQEVLAANPNLLNPSNLPSSALFTRSDAPNGQHVSSNLHQSDTFSRAQTQSAGNNLTAVYRQQQQQQADTAGSQQLSLQQQLYRGYSLIELDVKSESDRRYVQELYANLSNALNEQAQNPNALTVSPYVDVDFWSFNYALNDQIDIMVSPKSRAFILGQLGRAKIRHRIKIDDIQSRLDQQLPIVAGASASESASGSASALSQAAYGKSSSSTGDGLLSGRGGQSSAYMASMDKRDTANTLNARQASSSSAAADGTTSSNGAQRKPMNESVFFENYQRLSDINQYVESIVERNREVAQVKVIGRSSHGRYLRVLKLGYDQQEVHAAASGVSSATFDGGHNRRQPAALNNASYILDTFLKRQASIPKLGSIWLDGGTHAREWISPSTVLYIAFRLSDNHNRCLKFFDTMRVVVNQAASNPILFSSSVSSRSSRGYYATQPAPPHSALDADLLTGINEINTSLLGKPVQQNRPRTELEHTLELLAKNPQEVASEHGCDLDMDQLLRRYTFYIMPVLNPDGYEYSHTHNRLWRKTRSTSNHPIYRHFCLGADPNRNYDARHGATGSSTHPCSQTFAGSVPFTEPETRHQSNFVYANRFDMKMYISFHSYSQMILLPFSHSKQLPPDHKDLESVGQAAAKAIERTHGTLYRVGPSASILYTASGTASDWAYEKAGIKYSYTIELRDTGTYGFLLPRNQIIPTGEETFNGLMAMIGQMEKNDNLLTSKSLLGQLGGIGGANLTGTATTIDYNHMPELDRLQPFSSKHRPRPTLENVLGGGSPSTWLASSSDEFGPPPSGSGVRDRKPTIVNNESVSSNHLTADQQSYGPEETYDVKETTLSGQPPSRWPYEEEPIGGDNEPDSGYAFEGEGELLEPSRENILEATKLVDQRLAGRQDHSRRIAQSAGLTASGRNFINSPLTSRATPSAPKRESSDDLIEVVTTA